jgi:hypothetical protein
MTVGSQQMAVEKDGAIDLVWTAMTAVDLAVFFARSTDSATFSSPQELELSQVPNFTGGGNPVVGVHQNGVILVVWSDDSRGAFSGDSDIYFRQSTDGKTFSDATDLSNIADQTEGGPMLAPGTRDVLWSGQQGVYFFVIPQ